MKAEKGYYSLIQFCPNASRMETVNVGVVLFCPHSGFLDAMTTGNNRRAKQLAGADFYDRYSLNAAKLSIEKRLVVNKEAFDSLEDLKKFVETRGNDLMLTEPRPIKVFNPEKEMLQLFEELVGGVRTRDQLVAASQPPFPELESAFEKLVSQHRAEKNYKAELPMVGSLKVPYAYNNGVFNLVKPQQFPKSSNSTMGTAMKLAVQGDVVHNKGTAGHSKSRLVVVSEFNEEGDPDTPKQVEELFKEYHIKHVPYNRVRDFVKQVEKEAHA